MSKTTFFAPQLFIPRLTYDISFYEKAFAAKVMRLIKNEDNSIHVAELSINGALFHLHEITAAREFFNPAAHKGTTVLIGLFVENVDAVVAAALKAGAVLTNPAQSYDYGYRQAEIKDPFGHYWMIEMKI